MTLNQAIETAKNKAAGHPAWMRAIDRAVAESPAWIVTELHGYLLITSASGETYRTNGHCNCRAGVLGKPCKHLAYRRLRELAEAEPVATRDELIADIKRLGGPNLADELLRRFRCSDLNFFSIDILTAIKAAIA